LLFVLVAPVLFAAGMAVDSDAAGTVLDEAAGSAG
jgi:hypothetical protein